MKNISMLLKNNYLEFLVNFPTLNISTELKDIDNIKEEFFNIENYSPQSSIKAPMIA